MGDDPSFFQAARRLGDPRLASWGVCRWEVRQQLQPGDLAIFICACEGPAKGVWDYYYVGYGTVRLSLQREEIFRNDEFADYRIFFNMISQFEEGEVVQYEVFGDKHGHFEDRCRAGYILFHPDATDFNLTRPLAVAHYEPGEPCERWHLSDPQVAYLQSALWLDGTIDRTLNTGNRRRPHAHIPIHEHLKKAGRVAELPELRQKLAEISADMHKR